jgi:hypothetical protein
MKKTLVLACTAVAAIALAAPTASAQPPDAVTATAVCDGYAEPIETWIPNVNAAFFNQNRNAPVGATAIAIDFPDGRVGVVFADEGIPARGRKAIAERGFETTECDITVPAFDEIFNDVTVKIAPS